MLAISSRSFHRLLKGPNSNSSTKPDMELPPCRISTSIAISMIERIANIPIGIRRDKMASFLLCLLPEAVKSEPVAVSNQFRPLLLCGDPAFRAGSLASGGQRAFWSGSAISRARGLTKRVSLN
jgi:hypothetical protein